MIHYRKRIVELVNEIGETLDGKIHVIDMSENTLVSKNR